MYRTVNFYIKILYTYKEKEGEREWEREGGRKREREREREREGRGRDEVRKGHQMKGRGKVSKGNEKTNPTVVNISKFTIIIKPHPLRIFILSSLPQASVW